MLNKVAHRFKRLLVTRRRPLLFSMSFSALLMVLTYLGSNLPIPLGGEKELLRKLNFIDKIVHQDDTAFLDSVLFVNVTYDKVINPNPKRVNDEIVGHIPITDRSKLLKLLQYLKDNANYKFVMLDVFFDFEDGPSSHTDSALFETILSMDRIVIPYHGDERIADERLLQKAGLSDLNETYFRVGFSKYSYLSKRTVMHATDGTKAKVVDVSLPLKMYGEVTNREIKRHWNGLFYTDGKRLAKRSSFLPMDVMADKAVVRDSIRIWLNLGMDLLGDTISYKVGNRTMRRIGQAELYHNPELTRNKYIVVGACQGDDEHFTFKGSTSGAVINYNAFCSLMEGRHLVRYDFVVTLFLLYFFLTYYILTKNDIKEYAEKSKRKLVRSICKVLVLVSSWLSYATVLTLLCLFTYICFGETHEILVTSTVFYLLSKIINSKTFQSWRKQT